MSRHVIVLVVAVLAMGCPFAAASLTALSEASSLSEGDLAQLKTLWAFQHQEMAAVPQVFREAAQEAEALRLAALWQDAGRAVAAKSTRRNGLGAMNCGECETLIGFVEGMVRNSTQINKTITSLDGVCSLVYLTNAKKAAECKKVVAIVAKVLGKLFHMIGSLAWNMPLTFCADVFKSCTMPCCQTRWTPEQVHLAFSSATDYVSQMRVTWVTLKATPGAGVYFRVANASSSANFTFAPEEATRSYTQGGWLGTVHTAVMTGLPQDSQIEYYVGTQEAPSATFDFWTLPTDIGLSTSQRPLRVVAIADMGYGPNSNDTINSIAQLAQNRSIHAVLHYGDISYADGDEEHWDVFWRKVEPIASRVPYMTTPGNHEMWWNFSAYKARAGWSMPRAGADVPSDSMYYSLRIGPLGLLMLDSETWIDTADIDATQVAWASRQLALANSDRMATPFLWVVQHRPLYCTTHMALQCEVFATLLRGQVEALMVEAKVDMGLAGHMHHYERTVPVVSGVPVSTSYMNATAPFYICNGAAGNREGNGMPQVNQPWSVKASGHRNVGFQVIEVVSDPAVNLHTMTSTFYDSRTQESLDRFVVQKSV